MVKRKLRIDIQSLRNINQIYEKDTIVEVEILRYTDEFLGKVKAKVNMPGGESLWIEETLLEKP